MRANLLIYNPEKIRPPYALSISLSAADMESLPNSPLEGMLTFGNAQTHFVFKIDATRPHTTIEPANGELQSKKTITLGRKAYDLIKNGRVFTEDIGDYSLAVQ